MARKQESTANSEPTKEWQKRSKRVVTYRLEMLLDGDNGTSPVRIREEEVIVDSIRDAKLIRRLLLDGCKAYPADTVFQTVRIIQQPKLATTLED